MDMLVKALTKTFPQENLLLFVPSKLEELNKTALNALSPQCFSFLQKLLKEESFDGEKGRHLIVPRITEIPGVKRLILIGVGSLEKKEMTLRTLSKALEQAVRMLPRHMITKTGVYLDPYTFSQDALLVGETMGLAAYQGAYKFLTYKTKEKEKVKYMEKLFFVTAKKPVATAFEAGLKKATVMNEYITLARNLINEPSHVVTPGHMADRARALAKKLKLKATVWDKKALKKAGMNLIYAVGQGATEEPCLVMLEYNGAPKSKEHYTFVGKGVTFDTGGVSLKPANYMRHMKVDMTGSACVLSTICIAAALKMPVNVKVFMPLVENAVGSGAYKPDDVIKAYNGLTVEIENTDAEGRLILADALSYASTLKPTQMIDIGTLTGAAIGVTAGEAAPFMGTSEALIEDLKKASNATGERIWQLPLWDEYDRYVKSAIADVCNLYVGRDQPGTIACGTFLKHFVDKNVPWVHVDIAGVSLVGEGSMDAYPSGFGIRLFVKYLEGKVTSKK